MIIEAQNEDQTIDVVINPVNVLLILIEEWRMSIGVPHYSPIMGGYWMRHGLDCHERVRLATRQEIIQNEAFYTMLDLTNELY